MRKFILSSLSIFSHIAIFLILLSGVIRGAIGGGVGGETAGVILFGALFLLMDIAVSTRRTAVATEAMRSDRGRPA